MNKEEPFEKKLKIAFELYKRDRYLKKFKPVITPPECRKKRRIKGINS